MYILFTSNHYSHARWEFHKNYFGFLKKSILFQRISMNSSKNINVSTHMSVK